MPPQGHTVIRGTLYDGRRQDQRRRPRPTRTPILDTRTRRASGLVVVAAIAAIGCFCGGFLGAAATWLLYG